MNSSVRIIGYTQDPDRIASSSARISTTAGDSLSIFEHSRDCGKNQALVRKVLASGHKTIIEHISFNLAFINVSACVEQFMIEFRLASFTVKSRRYVDFGSMGYFTPAFTDQCGTPLEKADELQRIYHEHMTFLFQEYEAFAGAGIPKEDARFLLPYSYQSNFYCTVNARELYHILSAMLYGHGRGYAEINALGKELAKQASHICPYIFDDLTADGRKGENKYDTIAEIAGIHDCETAETYTAGDFVELLAYTPEPEKAVARAALTGCTALSSPKIDLLLKDPSCVEKLLTAVLADRRPRELEQISFTFRINSLSLAAVTHITRHRMQSIIIPPLYAACTCGRYMIPDTVKAEPALLQRYREAFARTGKLYGLFRSHGLNRYALSYLFLSGNVTDITTTMNGRELRTFISLRTCNRAQWEIRAAAIDMLRLLRNVSPFLFGCYGPGCYVTGSCPEGKMTCGKYAEVQKSFGA